MRFAHTGELQGMILCLFQIGDFQECKNIHDLYLLWDLKLRGNPVQVIQ